MMWNWRQHFASVTWQKRWCVWASLQVSTSVLDLFYPVFRVYKLYDTFWKGNILYCNDCFGTTKFQQSWWSKLCFKALQRQPSTSAVNHKVVNHVWNDFSIKSEKIKGSQLKLCIFTAAHISTLFAPYHVQIESGDTSNCFISFIVTIYNLFRSF